MPFTSNDTVASITNKIISLKQETLKDTKQLINPEALKQATQLIINSDTIKLFGANNIIYEISEFQFKLSWIIVTSYLQSFNENSNILPLDVKQLMWPSLFLIQMKPYIF